MQPVLISIVPSVVPTLTARRPCMNVRTQERKSVTYPSGLTFLESSKRREHRCASTGAET